MAKESLSSMDCAAHTTENQILDSLTAMIAVLDRNGTITYVNDAWRRFSSSNGGSRSATGVGVNYLEVCRSASDKDSFTEDQACRGIEDVLMGAREFFKLEYPCHSPTQQRWFLLYVSRLKGQQHSVVTTHLSITERKLTEQRLFRAEGLAAIGQAMAGLSHEGRRSLQRAQASIDVLRMHIADDGSDAVELLGRIERAQEDLLSVYEEVRAYAAPVSLCREAYRLDKLVDEVWSALASQDTPAPSCHISGRGSLTAEIDLNGMRSVLRSVLQNALTAVAESPEVDVCCREDSLDGSPAVIVIVSDSGPGVPAEHWEKAFEPFYTTKPNGTGLGLAVCRRIVSAHGGRIYFSAAQRKGASLYITLPITAPTAKR